MATDSLTSLFDSVVEADAKTDATATAAPSRNHSPERRGSFGFNLQRRRSRSNTVSPLTQYSSYESMRPPKDGQSDGTFLENGQNTLLPPTPSQASLRTTKGISLNLAALLVYTVGVRFRGLGKKEHYAVEHMFSLSEKKADKLLKDGNISYFKSGDMPEASGSTGSMLDLIKHCQTHLVRVYPKGMRLLSTNYLPHRYWAAGAQLVSLNWQTSGESLPLLSGISLSGFAHQIWATSSTELCSSAMVNRGTFSSHLHYLQMEGMKTPFFSGRDMSSRSRSFRVSRSHGARIGTAIIDRHWTRTRWIHMFK